MSARDDKFSSFTPEYVLEHFDEALEKGVIEVFYQPVVRALTNRLCGMESLARWVDPEMGIVSPYKFISVLEQNNLIHKLDCYVIKRTCESIKERLSEGKPVVPASVNLSRLDFQMCDMLDFVERATTKNSIPRDYLHIEITESMLVADEGHMREVITSFRDAGYEVWMDDFGSAYSSLNLLKDYDFDMIKLDMDFLSSFTDKSKAILSSTVGMAKDIGMKTLAEGVETAEQLEFLKSIGCERIQGFLFGKPQPLEDMYLHIEEQGIEIEKRQWHHFYDVAAFHVRNTMIPLLIFEDDGNSFKTLFVNQLFKEQVFAEYEMNEADIDRRIYHAASPLMPKFREFAGVMEETGNVETFYYTDNGSYYRLSGKCLVSHEGHYILQVSIINISLDQNTSERERIDAKLREINHLYEVVHLFNVKSNVVYPLLGRFKYIQSEEYVYSNLRSAVNIFVDNNVFPTERDEYLKYMDLDTLGDRIKASGRGYIEKIFRIKQTDGTYKRKNNIVLMVPSTDENEYLCCFQAVPDEVDSILNGLSASASRLMETYRTSGESIGYAELWENIIWQSSLKMFWKDKNRRFLGVSQSFMHFYGIKSYDDIIGKTDEEMHWHVNETPYMDDELDVIGKGKIVSDAQGQCIVGGVVHDISCHKIPVYRNGEIVGLVGFFVDKDEELYRMENVMLPTNLDCVTNLMNAKAFIINMMEYATQYNDEKRNYGIIVIKSVTYERILGTYGKETSDKFLSEMGRRIVSVTGQTCAVARVKESYFAILTYANSTSTLEFLAGQIQGAVERIREIDGNSVTVRTQASYKLRTEEGITDENIYNMALEALS